ncbi:MAG: thermonuclease family protein [Gammaproteobacteria bacterium]|nr:thermonuclease family protein [Gammaproteobacteria bacterium]MDH5692634.1 thermonuclease family protein [Gammaproteobacteria bacterium]
MSTNSVKSTERNSSARFESGPFSYWPTYSFPLLIFLILLFCGEAHAQSLCSSTSYHEKVEFGEVVDGNTISNKDGDLIRFIGTVAPEAGKQGFPDAPFAQQTISELKKKFANVSYILLRRDNFRRDNRQQRLAHVFLPDETNVNAWLLNEGLAAYVPTPPNLWKSRCYKQAADQAQSEGKGMWGLERYRAHDPEEIDQGFRGLYTVEGRVKRITSNRRGVWLYLSDDFALRINRYDLKRFKFHIPEGLKSHLVHATGIVYPYGSGVNMRIWHPDGMTVID